MTTEQDIQGFMMMDTHKEYPYEKPLPENVIQLGAVTSKDLPVDTILRAAYDSQLKDIVVCGTKPDGRLYFSTSMADLAVATFMMQRGIHRAMEYIEEQEFVEPPEEDQPA